MYHEEMNRKSQCQDKGSMAWGWWPTLTRTKTSWDGRPWGRGSGINLQISFTQQLLSNQRSSRRTPYVRGIVSSPSSARAVYTHFQTQGGSPQQQTHSSGAFTHPELDNTVKRISQDTEHGENAILLKTLAPANQITAEFHIPVSCVAKFRFSGWLSREIIS